VKSDGAPASAMAGTMGDQGRPPETDMQLLARLVRIALAPELAPSGKRFTDADREHLRQIEHREGR